MTLPKKLINFSKTRDLSVLLESNIESSISMYFMDLNSYCLYLTNDEYCEAITCGSIVFSDGYYVHRILRNSGSIYYPGPDFFNDFINMCDSIFLLGPEQCSVDKFKTKLQKSELSILVENLILPNFRDLSDLNLEKISEEINRSKCPYIAVILGCPKQELLINNLINRTSGKVFLGLGAAFNFYLGSEKRAHYVIRKFKLEWVIRIFMNPKKMFGKYKNIFPALPKLVLNFFRTNP